MPVRCKGVAAGRRKERKPNLQLVLDLVPENDLLQAFDYGFFDVSVILNAVYA